MFSGETQETKQAIVESQHKPYQHRWQGKHNFSLTLVVLSVQTAKHHVFSIENTEETERRQNNVPVDICHTHMRDNTVQSQERKSNALTQSNNCMYQNERRNIQQIMMCMCVLAGKRTPWNENTPAHAKTPQSRRRRKCQRREHVAYQCWRRTGRCWGRWSCGCVQQALRCTSRERPGRCPAQQCGTPRPGPSGPPWPGRSTCTWS